MYDPWRLGDRQRARAFPQSLNDILHYRPDISIRAFITNCLPDDRSKTVGFTHFIVPPP
jgi:hypothetical protein